jgi:selenocysteine lyase/cysteine desulfurase
MRVRAQLPPRLVVADVPGMPTAGVRSTLRDRFGVEAALGNFGERGNFIRLSHAVYNAPADFERLRDAVLELVEEQERQ